MKNISHHGKWIDFNDATELAILYVFNWPAALYNKAIENNILHNTALKILMFIPTFVLMGIWLFVFIWLWVPVSVGLMLYQMAVEK